MFLLTCSTFVRVRVSFQTFHADLYLPRTLLPICTPYIHNSMFITYAHALHCVPTHPHNFPNHISHAKHVLWLTCVYFISPHGSKWPHLLEG